MTGGESEGMRYFMIRLVWIVSIFTMLAVFMSCGKAKEAATEKAIESSAAANGQKVDVDLSGDKMTVKGEEGTTVVEGDKATITNAEGTTKIDGDSMEMTSSDGKVKMVSGDKAVVPADFPKDVAVYPGAKVTMAATDAGEKTVNLNFESKDPIDKVSAFFTKELTAQGWKEDTSIVQPDKSMNMLHYQKDNRSLMCIIMAGTDATNISMTLQTEEQQTAPAAAPEAAEEAPAEEAPAQAQ